MNIVFLSRLFYPHIGGVEKHVLEVGKRLVKQGHTVTIITEQLDESVLHKKIPSTEIISGMLVYRIDVGENDWFKKFRIWKQIWKLREVINKANIVHCHDVFFWYYAIFIFISN
jgi:glycosyltransferase involved in cell wall biosynthesis